MGYDELRAYIHAAHDAGYLPKADVTDANKMIRRHDSSAIILETVQTWIREHSVRRGKHPELILLKVTQAFTAATHDRFKELVP